jgi:hypothetical protein
MITLVKVNGLKLLKSSMITLMKVNGLKLLKSLKSVNVSIRKLVVCTLVIFIFIYEDLFHRSSEYESGL